MGEVDTRNIRVPAVRTGFSEFNHVKPGLMGFPEVLRVNTSGIVSRELPYLLGLMDMA
ncbi:hypothetical protein Holit_03231 [Hollandina sp. SP2]